VIGRVVGKYKILDQIGEGGMGVVYGAEHITLGSPAAIKVLLPQYTRDTAVVDRFFTEAKATGAIRHVSIVQIYDYGRLPNGQAYIAMELLRGEDLTSFITRHRILDPMGLGLERYDGIGRYRETYGNGDAIDPAGTLPDGTACAGPDQLSTILSQDPRFGACVASKLYTYALGREVETLDAPILDKLKTDWATRGMTLRNLMKEVATSNAFRFRRGEAQ
jgi:hypothetical protein